MPHTIETAPRNGEFVIIVDDASGRFHVAQWSTSREWVRENGEPSEITPSHWSPISSGKYQAPYGLESSNASQDEVPIPVPFGRAAPQEPAARGFVFPYFVSADAPVIDAPIKAQTATVQPTRGPDGRRRFAISIAAASVAALLIGSFLHAEIATFLTRYPSLQNIFGEKLQLASQELRKLGLLARQPQAELDQIRAPDDAQVRQAGAASVLEARQSLESKERSDALVNELAEARRTIDAINLQLRAKTARVQSLEQDREKAAAFAQTAATAREELTANAEQYRGALEKEQARTAALASELATARRENEMQAAQLRTASEEIRQLKAQAANSQLLEQERRKSAALAQQAAAARQELTTSTEKYRQALDEERARHATLWSELAAAQREIEAQAAQLRGVSEETGQLKQAKATNSAQSLEQERQKAAALAQQAAAARQELTTSTEKHRQALDEERAHSAALKSELATAQRENELQAAQLRKASEETGQLKQATERAMTELRQSLQQERDRTEAMARDIQSARRTVDVRPTPEPTVSSLSKAAQVIEVAATAQPAAVEAQASPEATKLIARARALLGQGNIGGARIVLERAAETGSARASFTLAETYDPVILSTWGTYGTRGDTTKARELYAKAHAGGILDAKDRLERLGQ